MIVNSCRGLSKFVCIRPNTSYEHTLKFFRLFSIISWLVHWLIRIFSWIWIRCFFHCCCSPLFVDSAFGWGWKKSKVISVVTFGRYATVLFPFRIWFQIWNYLTSRLCERCIRVVSDKRHAAKWWQIQSCAIRTLRTGIWSQLLVDYCNSLMYGIISANMKKLWRVQNALICVICSLGPLDYVSGAWSHLHWLPMEQWIIFLDFYYNCKSC